MLAAVITAVISFISTNLDDIFVLTLFFAQEDCPRGRVYITLGQYVGIGILAAVSLLGAGVLRAVPDHWLGLLGLAPVALGVKAWLDHRKGGDEEDETQSLSAAGVGKILQVALVTVANGGDNIGVYLPLFAGCSGGELALTLGVFTLMIGVWCLLARRLAQLPVLRENIQRYKHIVIPVVFIALGIYIMVEHMLF